MPDRVASRPLPDLSGIVTLAPAATSLNRSRLLAGVLKSSTTTLSNLNVKYRVLAKKPAVLIVIEFTVPLSLPMLTSSMKSSTLVGRTLAVIFNGVSIAGAYGLGFPRKLPALNLKLLFAYLK